MCKRMTKTNDKCSKLKKTSIILAFIAVTLIIVSFFIPPISKIDPSVLTAFGEIVGLIAIFFGWDAVDQGHKAEVHVGGTTIAVNKQEDEDGTETQ